MSDRTFLILVGVGVLAVVIFYLARRLLDRGTGRSLALVPPDGGSPDAPAEPPMAARVDRSFQNLIFQTGLGLTTTQTLWLFALAALTLAAALFFWSGDELATAFGLVLGIGLLLLAFWILRARRRRLFQGQLPDAFYYLARSLRAGLSLDQALTQAGEQLEEPLAGEFRRCAAQMQLGLHPYQSLRNMAARLDLVDFDVFVSTVGLYYQSGGNLALLLDRLAASTRDRIQFLGYFRAATALGRAAGFILAAAVPVIVIVYAIMQPEYLSALYTSTETGRVLNAAGWRILGIAAGLDVIGIIWFLYLLRVDY